MIETFADDTAPLALNTNLDIVSQYIEDHLTFCKNGSVNGK